MTHIDLVVFDKDGTLFEFEATWGVWVAAVVSELATANCPAAVLAESVGFDLRSMRFASDSLAIAGSGEEVMSRWQALCGDHRASDIRAVCEKHEHALPVVPCGDVAGALGALRGQRRAIAVATNDYARIAKAHLRQSGLAALVDEVLACDSGFGAKPEPGMLLAACAQVGVTPARAAMVGDSTCDLEAARNAGFALAIAVLTGPADRCELAPIADVVLESLAELPNYLEQVATQSR